MHHICEVLDWPTVKDLYPFVGMRAERRTKRKSPAKPRTVKSLAASVNAAQGACTPSERLEQLGHATQRAMARLSELLDVQAPQGTCTPVDSTCDQRVTGQTRVSGLRLDYAVEAAGMCLDAPYRIPRGSVKGYDCHSGGYQADSIDFRGGSL